MLQRLGIRGKLLAVVAVPVIVLVAISVFIVSTSVTDYNSARNAAQMIGVLDTARTAEEQLSEERWAAVNYLNTVGNAQAGFTAGVTDTEAQLAALADAATRPEEQALVAQVYDTLGGEDAVLAEERAIQVQPPESAENVDTLAADPEPFLVFPDQEAVATAAQSYETKAAAVAEIANDPAAAPLQSQFNRLVFAIRFEGQQFTALNATGLQYQDLLREVYPKVDAAFERMFTEADEVPANERNERALDSVQNGVVLYGQIKELRRGVMLAQVTSSQALGGYSDLLWGMVNVTPDISVAIDDRELVSLLDDYSQLDRLVESMRYERIATQRILDNGEFGPSEAGSYRTIVARTDLALEDAQTRVIGAPGVEEIPDFGASQSEGFGDNRTFDSIRTTLLSGLDASVQNEAGVGWPEKAQQEIDVYDDIRATLWNEVRDRSDAYTQSNLFRTIVTTVVTVLAIALTIIIALVIARRIINPLRRLTTTATAVRQELPRLVERVAMPGEVVDVAEVQIPVESQDEVGRLAEAFNGVNAATLAIASEQAALRGSISEMFVNVARRDQVLLNRQLASIDEMERTEDNPGTLTKLFALDHLATRMRRNSESLLVLAGIDTGRRLRRPMPLSDVIRTASSEIELYERVELELDADPAMVGHSALTAAHLFAELLENATVFSDPGTPVVVRTTERDGNYVVEISDSGIGMTEQELADANSRVASTAASEILGAQRLGLFVVGRIARRIGARVEIASTEGEGTLATITMGPQLFDARETVDPVHTSAGTVDEDMHAPAALVSHDVDTEVFDEPSVAQPAPSLPGYQPAVVAGGALLAGRSRDDADAGEAESVESLIAADAAAAPAAEAVDHEALNGGIGSNGLPTRRRRDGASADAEGGEDKNVIGLPVRATAAQLSALEAEAPAESFTPAVSANELSPQTPEQRASMFRGFRSRRDLAEPEPMMDPEAESLGQAARRGALTPDDLATLTPAAVPALEDDETEATLEPTPALESDEDAAPAALAEPEIVHDAPTHTPEAPTFHMPKFDAGDAAMGAAVATGIVAGFGGDDDEAPAPVAGAEPMVVPLLEDDDEFDFPTAVEPEPEPVPEPAYEAAVEPEYPAYEQPVAYDAPVEPAYEQPTAAPAYEAPVAEQAAVPFSLADVYRTQRAPEPTPDPDVAPQPQYWGVEQVSLDDSPTAPPTIDEIIGGPADDEAAKSGFFSRLFGRGKKDDDADQAAAAVATGAVAGAATAAAFHGFGHVDEPATPPTTAPEPEPYQSSFAPTEPEPASSERYPAPAYAAPTAPAYEAPVAPVYEEPAEVAATSYHPSSFSPGEDAPGADHAEHSAGGAFSYWSDRRPEPQPEPHAPAHGFTPDELANPLGWEAAGASALAASAPEQATEYRPVVDINPDPSQAPEPDMTSAVFSELSSLTVSRPKVEKTAAGLQRRRSADAPPVEVKPIEPEVAVEHKERDAEAVRSRFSSFYSGTQRARTDVAEFEQRAHPSAVKE